MDFISRERKVFARAYGLSLEARRKDLRMTQGELAAEAQVHRNTIAQWEQGKRLPEVFQHTLLEQALQRREAEMSRPVHSANRFQTAIALPGLRSGRSAATSRAA